MLSFGVFGKGGGSCVELGGFFGRQAVNAALGYLVGVLVEFKDPEDPFSRAAEGHAGDSAEGDRNAGKCLDRVGHDAWINVGEGDLGGSK